MQTIIVTTDFSDTAVNAAHYVAGLSQKLDVDRIVLYHSYDQSSGAIAIPVAETDTAIAHESSMLQLEALQRALRESVIDRIVIEVVANELPLEFGVEQLVEQWHAGLVVVGKTGKSGVEKFLVGSNTISLASSCSVPLLIVPRDIKYQAIEKIAFACDLERVSRSTPVSEIGWWLNQLQASLLVLNVALKDKSFNPDVILEQYAMHDLLDVYNPSYHYTEGRDVAEEIADFVEREGVELVVTVPKSYGFFEGLFHKSVSKRLTEKTEIPLLLLKEKQ